jgi:hypothetical protein
MDREGMRTRTRTENKKRGVKTGRGGGIGSDRIGC